MSVYQLFGLSAIEIVGDFAFKRYANEGGIVPLIIGVVGYIGVMIMLVVSLQDSTVLMVNGGWDGMSAILESICAYVFLGERFANYLQYVGLMLIIGGIYLLKIPWKKTHIFHIPKI